MSQNTLTEKGNGFRLVELCIWNMQQHRESRIVDEITREPEYDVVL